MPTMKMKNPKEEERINEYEKQINYWKDKCGLTDKEAKKNNELCKTKKY